MEIKTERLILKPFENKDEAAMVKIFLNDEVKKTFMIPDFKTLSEPIKLFQRYKELSESSNFFVLGIYLDDKLVGFINEYDKNEDEIELGYVISPEYKNNGYATEALKASIDYLLKTYKTVVSSAFEENVASQRVMEKAGMIKIDQTDYIEYRNQNHKLIYYIKQNLQ